MKKVISMLLVAILLVMLTACGSQQSTFSEANTPSESTEAPSTLPTTEPTVIPAEDAISTAAGSKELDDAYAAGLDTGVGTYNFGQEGASDRFTGSSDWVADRASGS